MKKNPIIFVVLLLLAMNTINAQRTCETMPVLDQQLKEDPSMYLRMEAIERHTEAFLKKSSVSQRAVITIPVVVHVLWRTSTENISEAQIMSQIDVLNKDFRATNGDINQVPAEFQALIADSEIEFCLAQQDPSGVATNGITRKSTTKTSWGTNDAVKKLTQGGVNPWNTSKYLNIWVCNIGGGILGYAQFPGGSTATDGVVNDYRYFGTTGTATPPFNKGRTASHEIGHYLNLRHIWGDATCGSDFVSDTPLHNTANYGCPTHPHLSTCSGAPKELFMDYMDYTDDGCMVMFSQGQKSRMRAVIESGGARSSLASSNGCEAPGGGGSCSAPSGLAASNIGSTTATVSWNAVSGATSYNLQYKPSSATTWTTVNTTSTTANLTSLIASTTYNTQVNAVCSGGSSPYSAQVNFTTTTGGGGGCSDPFEPNNSKNASKTIPQGSTQTALINVSTDLDWYKFTNTSSKRNIKIDMTSLPADYDMKLYRGNTLVKTSENDGINDELIIHNNSQGATTYYLYVYPWQGAFSANDCYDLFVQTSASGFRDDGSLSLEIAEDALLVYPNPATDMIRVRVPVAMKGTLNVYNNTGILLFSQELTETKGKADYEMNVSNYTNGIYRITWQSDDQFEVKSFIIAK